MAKKYIYELYSDTDIEKVMRNYNSKELLQEYTQGQNKDLPDYRVISETGKAHDKIYEVGVFYHDKELARGSAKTKREAEKTAALMALEKLGIIEGDKE